MLRVLRANWRTEYAPRNFRGAFIDVGDKKIATADEAGLRKEFFEFAVAIDRSWETNPVRIGIALNVQDFTGYPFIQKYVGSIRYIGGIVTVASSFRRATKPFTLCLCQASR